MSTQRTHSLPLHRHDSATQLITNNSTKPQAPQPIAASFPCSRRHHRSHNKPLATCPIAPLSPPPQPPKQDRLQTALLYLARAAAQLQPASALVESLYDFAAPNWTLERWETEVEREREKMRGVATAGGPVAGLREGDGDLGGREKDGASAGGWVRRAVGALRREGEDGEYWRDGRDLEVLWGRVGGGYV